eukprot:scaffold820_cov376-Prasinococcus_capsulatus_cf.AAC.22
MLPLLLPLPLLMVMTTAPRCARPRPRRRRRRLRAGAKREGGGERVRVGDGAGAARIQKGKVGASRPRVDLPSGRGRRPPVSRAMAGVHWVPKCTLRQEWIYTEAARWPPRRPPRSPWVGLERVRAQSASVSRVGRRRSCPRPALISPQRSALVHQVQGRPRLAVRFRPGLALNHPDLDCTLIGRSPGFGPREGEGPGAHGSEPPAPGRARVFAAAVVQTRQQMRTSARDGDISWNDQERDHQLAAGVGARAAAAVHMRPARAGAAPESAARGRGRSAGGAGVEAGGGVAAAVCLAATMPQPW